MSTKTEAERRALPWYDPEAIPRFEGDATHCRHPGCRDTNWGGRDRVHRRSSTCPPLPTAADQPTTEPSEAGLRIEHGWLVEETTGCTCAGGTEESSYLHEPGCGLTPLQRLDNLPGWPLAPAPQPAADTETEVQWGVRFPNGEERPHDDEDQARAIAKYWMDRAVEGGPVWTVIKQYATRTPWEEA